MINKIRNILLASLVLIAPFYAIAIPKNGIYVPDPSSMKLVWQAPKAKDGCNEATVDPQRERVSTLELKGNVLTDTQFDGFQVILDDPNGKKSEGDYNTGHYVAHSIMVYTAKTGAKKPDSQIDVTIYMNSYKATDPSYVIEGCKYTMTLNLKK